jgi:hypothetical protein
VSTKHLQSIFVLHLLQKDDIGPSSGESRQYLRDTLELQVKQIAAPASRSRNELIVFGAVMYIIEEVLYVIGEDGTIPRLRGSLREK